MVLTSVGAKKKAENSLRSKLKEINPSTALDSARACNNHSNTTCYLTISAR